MMKRRSAQSGAGLWPDPHIQASKPGSTDASTIVHIGYHKTASTWLQLCVFPHLGQVRYGDPILRYLLADLATAPAESFFAAPFERVFRQSQEGATLPVLLSDEGVSGSLWDGYGAGPRSAERLAKVLPDSRILVLVRRQDDMLRSIHGQYVNEGGTRSLGDFLSGRRIEGSRLSLEHLEYDKLVRLYVDLFGRDRVRVMPYEYLRAQPSPFLHDLCAFVGSELSGRVSARRQNRSLTVPSLWLLRTWNRLFRQSRFNPQPVVRALPGGRRARNLLQGRVDPILRRLAGNLVSTKEDRTLEEIAARFSASNRRLQQFCADSLSEWGYPLQRALAPAAPDVSVLTRHFEPAAVD
jgi:hypothetical protein